MTTLNRYDIVSQLRATSNPWNDYDEYDLRVKTGGRAYLAADVDKLLAEKEAEILDLVKANEELMWSNKNSIIFQHKDTIDLLTAENKELQQKVDNLTSNCESKHNEIERLHNKIERMADTLSFKQKYNEYLRRREEDWILSGGELHKAYFDELWSLRDAVERLLEKVEQWKDASMLERGGDPDGVTPEDLRKEMMRLQEFHENAHILNDHGLMLIADRPKCFYTCTGDLAEHLRVCAVRVLEASK